MNKDDFWNIIDEVNQACPSRDQESIMAVVTEKLMKLEINEILDFHLIQQEYSRAAYRNDLHAASEAMGAAPSNNGMQAFLYRDTTGFRHETLTDDPSVRKAVDDILLDFSGEENPRRECSYGLTDAGQDLIMGGI